MNIKLKYNDKNIEEKIDYSILVLYDRLGGSLDNILMGISLKKNSIALSGIDKGDKFEISTDDFSTGVMYVNDYRRSDDSLIINSISCNPSNKEKKFKIWRNVRLTEIMNDVALSYGLELKTYDITDYIYESICQINETDISMLDRICTREGYSIKVDNGCLVVFDERKLEQSENTITLSEENQDIKKIEFSYNQCVKSVTLSYFDREKGLITYTSENKEMNGSSITVNEYVSNLSEAKRFADNYLRNKNKYYQTANVTLKYNPKISAGTVFDVEDYGEFKGKYIAYEVCHDVILNVTKLKIRKVGVYE